MSWRFAAIMRSGCRDRPFGAIEPRKFERVFSDGKSKLRYIREIIYGKRRPQQFWELTTDPQTLPKNLTWYVMTHIPDPNTTKLVTYMA
jgi:SRSO17 transposase